MNAGNAKQCIFFDILANNASGTCVGFDKQGMCCPTTMTFAAVPALAAAGSDAIQEAWMPRLTARAYDGRNVPITEKRGVTLGMSMTEKQATTA